MKVQLILYRRRGTPRVIAEITPLEGVRRRPVAYFPSHFAGETALAAPFRLFYYSTRPQWPLSDSLRPSQWDSTIRYHDNAQDAHLRLVPGSDQVFDCGCEFVGVQALGCETG